MARGEEIADKVVEALAIKLRSMEEIGKGFHADGDITMYDRLIVVLGSLNKRYIDRVLEAEPIESDVKRVSEILEKHGVELAPEEVIIMSKIRKYIDEKLKVEGITILEKVIDVGGEVGMNSDQISIIAGSRYGTAAVQLNL